MSDRRPSPTDHVLQFFKFDHLPEPFRRPSVACASVAQEMADTLPVNPELTAGLRKLLEAKDCFVRAIVAEQNAQREREESKS